MVIRKLFLANARQIPEDDASVVASTTQNASLVRVPRQGSDGIIVTLESVDLFFNIAKIPDADSLVCRRSSHQNLGVGVKGKRINGIQVTTTCNNGGFVCIGMTSVDNL